MQNKHPTDSFKSNQEIRWCPGCGDYAILAAMQSLLPTLTTPREKTVFISGIGCSARFPYYVNTYGMHSIHGRALPIATGLAITRKDLSIWVITGDGDALSIGGNHLIHALRRNINLNILLFNNKIYGLTKGQYSPTSETGKITKSTPKGSLDEPLNPLRLAAASQASFIARALDTDRTHLTEVLQKAAEHKGSALIEIYQNCNIFNDKAFAEFKNTDQKNVNIYLEHDITPKSENNTTIIKDKDGVLSIASKKQTAIKTQREKNSEYINSEYIHNEQTINNATIVQLTELTAPEANSPSVFGIFRRIQKPTYDTLARKQVSDATKANTQTLQDLITGNNTWTIK